MEIHPNFSKSELILIVEGLSIGAKYTHFDIVAETMKDLSLKIYQLSKYDYTINFTEPELEKIHQATTLASIHHKEYKVCRAMLELSTKIQHVLKLKQDYLYHH